MSTTSLRLNGVILSGGRSLRMGTDKGALVYHGGLDQRTRCFKLLSAVCDSAWISCRREQRAEIPRDLPIIEDSVLGEGPGVGILSAFKMDPGAAWFVLACDFPEVDLQAIRALMMGRKLGRAATVYRNSNGILEPLFAIWEPRALESLEGRFASRRYSPREVLESVACEVLAPPRAEALLNMNSRV